MVFNGGFLLVNINPGWCFPSFPLVFPVVLLWKTWKTKPTMRWNRASGSESKPKNPDLVKWTVEQKPAVRGAFWPKQPATGQSQGPHCRVSPPRHVLDSKRVRRLENRVRVLAEVGSGTNTISLLCCFWVGGGWVYRFLRDFVRVFRFVLNDLNGFLLFWLFPESLGWIFRSKGHMFQKHTLVANLSA